MATHLLTGAGSGIGAALARLLAERGDDLVLIARSAARAADLAQAHPKAAVVIADLASDALERTLENIDPPDRLDSLVHLAGVVELASVADLTAEGLTGTLAVNLVAPAVLTRWALPSLRAGRGTIVFVNSTAALTVNASWASYAASKAGLKSLADAVRAEEASHGVRVTSVFPSRTATPMQQEVRRQEGAPYVAGELLAPDSVARVILQSIDLGDDATMPDVVLRPTGRA